MEQRTEEAWERPGAEREEEELEQEEHEDPLLDAVASQPEAAARIAKVPAPSLASLVQQRSSQQAVNAYKFIFFAPLSSQARIRALESELASARDAVSAASRSLAGTEKQLKVSRAVRSVDLPPCSWGGGGDLLLPC